MKNRNIFQSIGMLLCVSCLIGCGRDVKFADIPSGAGVEITSGSGDQFFPIQKTVSLFQQDKNESNITNVQFQVLDSKGQPVTNLTKDMIKLTESGTVISQFDFNVVSKKEGRKADIVFVIDSTSSMGSLINGVKTRVRGFVEELSKTNIVASVCLVHFGDTVRKSCTRFQDDDPLTIDKNENIDTFLSDLSRVTAVGGGDFPENQLEALIATAAVTPWHADAQRIAILITDEKFHYAPNFLGDAPTAPTYRATLDSLKANQVTTFIMGPDVAGYEKDFGTEISLTKGSGGIWYPIDEILSGKKDMKDVFKSIVDQLSITYGVTYDPTTITGLDPYRPIEDRKIEVALVDTTLGYSVRVINVSAKLANGVPILRSKFDLKEIDIDTRLATILVNGVDVTSKVTFEGTVMSFVEAPAAGSEIRVEYARARLRDNIQTLPIVLKTLVDPKNIEVRINEVVADHADLRFTLLNERSYLLELEESVFTKADVYKIRDNKGVRITVKF